MIRKTVFLLSATILVGASAVAQKVSVTNLPAQKKVEVRVDGQLMTSYIYPGVEVLRKPVLYPISTPQGTLITRGWPMDPRPGERVDHPHHVGAWFNHGDINGYDFWNSSDAVDRTKNKYGDIIHTGITTQKSGKGKGELGVTADWISQDRDTFLKEKTNYVFRKSGDAYVIDRTTQLTAAQDVTFKDSKEGVYGLRLARELEHPSNKPEVFTDANGVATKVASLNNAGVTGSYLNKEGVKGEEVWGKRSPWNTLNGTIKGENISVAIIDHPSNVGYPSYWHARGYGLFAVNPLGDKEFTSGKTARNHTLKKGESMTLKYRTVVASKHLTPSELDALAADFAKGK
jgi:hypothetical protein